MDGHRHAYPLSSVVRRPRPHDRLCAVLRTALALLAAVAWINGVLPGAAPTLAAQPSARLIPVGWPPLGIPPEPGGLLWSWAGQERLWPEAPDFVCLAPVYRDGEKQLVFTVNQHLAVTSLPPLAAGAATPDDRQQGSAPVQRAGTPPAALPPGPAVALDFAPTALVAVDVDRDGASEAVCGVGDAGILQIWGLSGGRAWRKWGETYLWAPILSVVPVREPGQPFVSLLASTQQGRLFLLRWNGKQLQTVWQSRQWQGQPLVLYGPLLSGPSDWAVVAYVRGANQVGLLGWPAGQGAFAAGSRSAGSPPVAVAPSEPAVRSSPGTEHSPAPAEPGGQAVLPVKSLWENYPWGQVTGLALYSAGAAGWLAVNTSRNMLYLYRITWQDQEPATSPPASRAGDSKTPAPPLTVQPAGSSGVREPLSDPQMGMLDSHSFWLAGRTRWGIGALQVSFSGQILSQWYGMSGQAAVAGVVRRDPAGVSPVLWFWDHSGTLGSYRPLAPRNLRVVAFAKSSRPVYLEWTILNGLLYVPLRESAQALGLGFIWQPAQKEVVISSRTPARLLQMRLGSDTGQLNGAEVAVPGAVLHEGHLYISIWALTYLGFRQEWDAALPGYRVIPASELSSP
ncbi:MAG: hypothetical protein IMW99_04085 [Firmicutes bacterium]|nr:hypothetical protein [Bacillota bacterium]